MDACITESPELQPVKLPDRLELPAMLKNFPRIAKLPQIDNHRKNNGGRMSRRFSFDGKILIVDGGRLKKQSAWPLGVQERRNDK